ncbi:MAG TPA: ribonuclease III [Pyrinomonadaceae bacterium]|jgi:ribonuclease-3|nr:ribonuclease III [Pyrinomonadaceae bacterium]
MPKAKHTEPDPATLEQTLAYTFNDRALLERALTHRSWAHEHVGPGEEEKARRLHNEAFEFVGDSVLGLVVADFLFHSYPDVTEGELSRMKHRLVSTQTLARVSTRLEFGRHLRVGRGEEKSGGRRKRALLADVFEAVLAAVYLDGGLSAATEFIHHALGEELHDATPAAAAAADYKTLLQEVLQAERRTTPTYGVVETQGPPHRRIFLVEVSWDGGQMRGEGRTIKAAEIEAARRALEEMGHNEESEQKAAEQVSGEQ